jgi:hypothetical protein
MSRGGFSEANWRDCQARLKNDDEWLKKLELQGQERGVRGAIEVKNALCKVRALSFGRTVSQCVLCRQNSVCKLLNFRGNNCGKS